MAKSYDQMLPQAKAISPAAKVIFFDDEWHIIIPSEDKQEPTLNARFEGTPVWEFTNSGEDTSALIDWAGKAHYVISGTPARLSKLPSEAIAEFYNFSAMRGKVMVAKRDELASEEGIDLSCGGEMSDEQFEAYMCLTSRASSYADKATADEYKAFSDRWQGVII